MTYKLTFHPKALKEWKSLDASIGEQFKKKLAERLINPKVPKDKLSGFDNVYKIKLRTAGFRLAYKVEDESVTILVLAVGKRENNKIYNLLHGRFTE
ncbi:MAG: addiction module toxin RelE [Sulfurimonas sp. RIFCSPHIGHO2_12_FULL_36_9]|uniref:type II toxin-antitoxin system RelE family toxin n=1 Tax=Sulfurimonas sp. RIFCSPLOWO2_12_36_12 TaxID=1802253 RepID=UPI0008BBD9CB|nr:type II toxin-antitoxin system RelE/ParE family toxin [Sulfurimonas sp. RIFCSPLOWO2_12_36_12]OHD97098.1 MAG: addiction module toxin RelE [Sulfurimonas sp. RIFCSPHIGHO2_12_FULL_36_9]OHE01754.1 MAG: addiction module toxin RelE [Sulfurimonas sp. RIFCSPLOWO2_12_36_12]